MKIKNQNKTKEIFSTGVFLESVECIVNSQKQWRWVAVGFEDDSFMNGKIINPVEYADKQKNLIEKFGDK